MLYKLKSRSLVTIVVIVVLIIWQLRLIAQSDMGDRVEPPKQQPIQSRTRFVFQVNQSFDERYLGDLPGHIGKGAFHGGEPDVSIGDAVYRNNVRIGKVTGLRWEWTKESLEVEFHPEEFEIDSKGQPTIHRVRITPGQDVWIPLGGHIK